MIKIFDIPESQFVERIAQDPVDPVCAQLHLISTCTLCYERSYEVKIFFFAYKYSYYVSCVTQFL